MSMFEVAFEAFPQLAFNLVMMLTLQIQDTIFVASLLISFCSVLKGFLSITIGKVRINVNKT